MLQQADKLVKTKEGHSIGIVSSPPELFHGRGISVVISDQLGELNALKMLELTLGENLYKLFTWTERHNGTNHLATGILQELISEETYIEIQNKLLANSQVLNCEPLKSLDVESEKINLKSVGAGAYDSSWYWPLDKRLPVSDYHNTKPIRIAQADTGISMHPNVVGGFIPGDSMNFYYPPDQRKGKGVICWPQDSAWFISHGTSTGGMMIGHPDGGRNLYGMAPRQVVEIVPCRVADSVVLAPSDVKRLSDCINWAIDAGIKVVNISLGAIATPDDPAIKPLTAAVERAFKSGVIVCCASGQLATGMIWPGVYALKGWTICCGPSNQNNQPSGQSIWIVFPNGYVTAAAPGEYMPLAKWKDGVCETHVAELSSSEGSSYSTAYMSSLAALWWALNEEALLKMNPADIVPLFRNTLVQSCNPWNGNYPKNFGPGIIDPNKLLQPALKPLQDYYVESKNTTHIEWPKGGTYKNVTLYAHSSGSIHVQDPIYVEGKLTLRAESSGSIMIPATVICRELEVICASSSSIASDDVEFYNNASFKVSDASTCQMYIAAEGPITGSVTGFFGSKLEAWIYWRQGKKSVSIETGITSSTILHGWEGRWA